MQNVSEFGMPEAAQMSRSPAWIDSGGEVMSQLLDNDGLF